MSNLVAIEIEVHLLQYILFAEGNDSKINDCWPNPGTVYGRVDHRL